MSSTLAQLETAMTCSPLRSAEENRAPGAAATTWSFCRTRSSATRSTAPGRALASRIRKTAMTPPGQPVGSDGPHARGAVRDAQVERWVLAPMSPGKRVRDVPRPAPGRLRPAATAVAAGPGGARSGPANVRDELRDLVDQRLLVRLEIVAAHAADHGQD